jgi:serine phosphatase RsbU (regulator of sigma subunit)
MSPNRILEEVPYAELKQEFVALEQKNKNLLDGLYYAAFVQQGLMPQHRHFTKLGYPYFVYYNPLQIIGGDFFWVGKKGDWDLMAVGDCTGHGVSGAMLSTLALGFLNYLVFSKRYKLVGDILDELDHKWIETFNKATDGDTTNNDWMEISLVAFNRKKKELQISSAMSNILIINDDGFEKHTGNHFPIGGWQIEKSRKFTTTKISVKPNTKVYLFSDGYKDQFGGVKNKRVSSKLFYSLLQNNAHLSMPKQKEELIHFFKCWKSDNEQTDDVCVMAFDLNY